jgi:hypothetical protein
MQPKCNPDGFIMLDEALALHEVQQFRGRVQTADGMWDAYGHYLNNRPTSRSER